MKLDDLIFFIEAEKYVAVQVGLVLPFAPVCFDMSSKGYEQPHVAFHPLTSFRCFAL